jgi:cyclic pyranopterin phosphate synthase
MEYELRDLEDEGIIDAFGRKVEKLRVAVTDRGNLRAQFLAGAEEAETIDEEALLTFEEIADVAKVAARLGIHQVKIAGGEPLERPEPGDLIELLSGIEGIDDLSLNTYGLKLENKIALLKEKGLGRITFNIDSLIPKRYAELTGGKLQTVLTHLRAVMQAGYENTKVNVLVMKGVNDDEIEDFVRLAEKYDIEVRFVEYVPHAGLRKDLFLPLRDILKAVSARAELEAGPAAPGRTATIYRMKNKAGKIGFITPISDLFCFECTRLQLSATGELVSCLIDGGSVNIKRFLRPRVEDTQSIEKALREAADNKPLKHSMHRFLQEMEEAGEGFDQL